ncbi:uncharacterized protein LOC134787856 [Penaeus indicus]|uniref:uncharacterized protein LOC134787856 n=1 Tax=Penaeus indicus TaxID=29960 RepID=UPI00300C4C26
MKRCKDDEEEDEWEPLRRRPALGRPGTSSSENEEGNESNGGVVPVACASQTHTKSDLPSSVAAIALTSITASGSSIPKTKSKVGVPDVNDILVQSVTSSSSQRKLAVTSSPSTTASALSASSGLESASFEVSLSSSASLSTQTSTATIKSLPPYAVASWIPEEEEDAGKSLSEHSPHSVASSSSSNVASDTSCKASDTQCTLTCKETPTTKTVEGVTAIQGSSKSVLAVDIVSVQNVSKKSPKPLVNGSITDSTIATTTDSVIFASGSLPARANGSLVVTSSLLGNSIIKDSVTASVSVKADSQVIVSVSSSKATRSVVASINKNTPTTLSLVDTATIPTTAMITIATSPPAEVMQAITSLPKAFPVPAAAMESLATSTVSVFMTTTAVTLPVVTATTTSATKLVMATAPTAATISANSSISTVDNELPSTEGETSATSVPITSTSANVLGSTLTDTGTSEQVCIQPLPRSSETSGSQESPASSSSDSSASDMVPRASTSLLAYSSSESGSSSKNDSLPASVSSALNPLQLLILSSDSSSESSNDSVGVVPSTYSVGGENQAQNSVEPLCLALHSINSLPAPTTTTSETFETAFNALSSENLGTESLGQDGTNAQENVSAVQLPSSVSSLLAASSSQSSSSSSSSSPSPENVSLTNTSNSKNSPHVTGSSTSATNQTSRKSTKSRNGWGKKVPENLMPEGLDDGVLTPASLDVTSDSNHRLMSRDAERKYKEKHIYLSGRVPQAGQQLPKGQLRRAGPYLLGPRQGSSPVRSIVQCLARRVKTDDFYTLKILTVREPSEATQDDRQGKMLLHTEHSLLSLLSGQKGVIQHHGLFQDYACGAREQNGGTVVASGGLVRRVCLVLDCVIPHDYCPQTADLINLQHYVINKEKLQEMDALTIFYNIVSVVHSLHEQNVVHRDLKLGNLVLHRATREITITNFCLGQHLPSEQDRLRDQRGSPAYISPDVLSGKPYLGKPSDMWALGVVLFTMLYGHFPFYDSSPKELFRKIKAAHYILPKSDKLVKDDTKDIIRGLLVLDPLQRLNCTQVLTNLTAILSGPILHNPQTVPEVEDLEDEELESSDRQLVSGSLSSNGSSLEPCYGSSRSRRPGEREADIQSKNNIDHLLLQVARQKAESCHLQSLKPPSSVTSSSSSSNSKTNGVISCIVGEARPLTQAEMSSLRHLLPHTPRLSEPVSRSSGPAPNVAVVVSRSNNDRFSPLFSPRSPSGRGFPMSPLGPPSSSHPQPPPNLTIPPSPLPPHLLSSHLSAPLSPHLPPSSSRLPSSFPRLPPSSSHSLTGSSMIPPYGSFSNTVPSQQRGPPPPAPPTGSRTRWAPGVHSRIVHNISSLHHLAASSNGQDDSDDGAVQDPGENDSSEGIINPLAGPSQLSQAPFHLVVRTRGRSRSEMRRRLMRR